MERKMRISYFRVPQFSIRGEQVEKHYKMVGCLVQEGNNWGISLCGKKDSFSKRLARQIAIGRLQKGGERACRNPKLPKNLEEQFQYYRGQYVNRKVQGVLTG